jgi:RNA polymerase sigma-70 factor (ECF subfamily)
VKFFFVLRLRSAVSAERTIRVLRESGDLHGAASVAIESYGPELFGYLTAVLRDDQDAQDAYAQTFEDMWRGLPGFEGRCAFRTWLYTLARHAGARLRRSPHGKKRRRVPLSEISELADRVRSETQPHLRTSAKDKLSLIRASLDEDDRSLLVLRIDRDMSWTDIARVNSPCDASDEELTRAAARLRKRYEFVKKRIKVLACNVGLLPGSEEA